MKQKFFELGKYSIAGLLNTIIAITVYTLLIIIGINYLASNIIGFFAGLINGYIWNNRWVFKVNSKSNITKVKYLLTGLFGLGLSSVLLIIFVELLKIDKIVSQFIVTVIIILINYLINKKWVFGGEKRWKRY